MENRIEIFCCNNSNSLKHLYGVSSSGKTKIARIKTFECTHQDDLFSFFLQSETTRNYSILCYDNITTDLTPTQIMNYIEKIIQIHEMDIFYLNRYCDSSYTNQMCFMLYNHKVVKVISPHGLDCILISPSCKEKLKKVIKQDNGLGLDFALNAYCSKLNAYSCHPNLFSIDNTFKPCENPYCKKCKELDMEKKFRNREYRDVGVKDAKRHNRNEGLINIIWFISMMFLLIFTFIFLFEDIEDVDNEVTDLELLIKEVLKT